jgi:hypothetical protein
MKLGTLRIGRSGTMLNRCPDMPGAKLAAGPIQGWRPVISQRVSILPKRHTAEAITRTATKSPAMAKAALLISKFDIYAQNAPCGCSPSSTHSRYCDTLIS